MKNAKGARIAFFAFIAVIMLSPQICKAQSYGEVRSMCGVASKFDMSKIFLGATQIPPNQYGSSRIIEGNTRYMLFNPNGNPNYDPGAVFFVFNEFPYECDNEDQFNDVIANVPKDLDCSKFKTGCPPEYLAVASPTCETCEVCEEAETCISGDFDGLVTSIARLSASLDSHSDNLSSVLDSFPEKLQGPLDSIPPQLFAVLLLFLTIGVMIKMVQ
jgi:hypothetical protein